MPDRIGDPIGRAEALETGARGYDRGLAERIEGLERRTDALAPMSARIAVLETALERMATEYDTACAVRLEAAESRLYALEQWRKRKKEID